MNNSKFHVYVSRPFSGRQAGVIWEEYRAIQREINALQENDPGLVLVNPFRGMGGAYNAEDVVDLDKANVSMQDPEKYHSKRDMVDLLGSDAVLVWIDDPEVISIGCIFEIAWAVQADIPVFMYRAKGSKMSSIMIDTMVDVISDNKDEVLRVLYTHFRTDDN